MPSVGDYYLTITPSFERGSFNKLGSEITGSVNGESLGKQLGDGMSNGAKGGLSSLKVAVGTLMGNLATDVFGAAVNKITELGAAAVEASDATDKFKSTLDFAGLDNGQIEALTASCKKYADETVYDLSDIQSITAQLAANNVADFDRLAEAAGNLNAVAGGNKDTFKSVGMVLTQTAGQGKLTTENFNQLSDAIPGASGKIQQELAKMGAYTGNFRDAMAKGEVSAEEFNQAILNLGFQDAAVEAATSTSTMEGAMGNLEASVVSLMMNGFDLIKPALTDVIGGVGDFIGSLSDVLGGIAQSPFFTDLVAKFQDFGARVMPVLSDSFGRLGEVFGKVAESVGPLISDVFGLLLDVIAKLVETVMPVVTSLFEALQPVFSFFVVLWQGVVAGVEAILVAVTPLGEIISTIAQLILDGLTGLFNWLSETFGPFFLDTLLPAMQEAWNQISEVITTFVDLIGPAIMGFIELVQPVWDGFCQALGAVASAVWSGIQSVVQTVMGVIEGIIKVVTGVISGDWSQVWEGIKQIASSVWEGIKGLVQAGIDAVKGIIDAILKTIKNLWDNAWNGLKDILGKAWEGIKSGVKQGIDNVLDFFKNLPQNILNALGNLGNLLLDAGKSIIDGFLNGLKSAWDGVTGWIGDIGGWIAEHKGPLDYDRRLLIPHGRAIMAGFREGLEDGFGDVRGLVSGMGMGISVTAGAASGMAPIATTNNYTLYIDGAAMRDPDAMRGMELIVGAVSRYARTR